MTDRLSAALAYAARGRAVLPLHSIQGGRCTCHTKECNSPGKHPRNPHGVSEASKDQAQIRAWWKRWPDANVAIATGAVSGLLVLDVDPRKGGDKSATEFDIPPTLEVATGSGGRHLFFKAPGYKTHNRVNLRPGLDARGNGGYVVAPPSNHISGGVYSCEDWEAPILEPPEWFLELVKKSPKHVSVPVMVSRPAVGHAKRVAAWIAKVPYSIQGQGGTRPFMQVVGRVAVEQLTGLLDPSDGMRIIQEYDSHSEPTWGQYEIDRALANCLADPWQSPMEDRPMLRRERNTAPAGEETSQERPEIFTTDQPDVILSKAWQALLAGNEPPAVFVREGFLVRIKGDQIEAMKEASLDVDLYRVAKWTKVSVNQKLSDDFPPSRIVRDMLSSPDEELPPLESMVTTPVFCSGGYLASTNGYHPKAKIYMSLTPDIAGVSIPSNPSAEDVSTARSLILDDLLVNFPFASQSDRAHAVAALILPFVRPMISGPTPLHLIESPSARTGKSLLAGCIGTVTTGRAPTQVTVSQEQDEIRKMLAALLETGPQVTLLDNVKRLDSAHLAIALTADVWFDRKIGFGNMGNYPIRTTWLATGNNVSFSNELKGRTVRIRLDAKMSKPGRRPDSAFKHRMPEWVHSNRAPLIRAVLTLVQSWVASGMQPWSPDETRPLGGFQSWSNVMGGVLDHVEIPGLLQNSDEFENESDDIDQEYLEFATKWSEGMSTACPASDLLRFADGLSELASARPEQRKQKMGYIMRNMRNRVIGKWCVTPKFDENAKVWKYDLVPVLEPNSPATPRETPRGQN